MEIPDNSNKNEIKTDFSFLVHGFQKKSITMVYLLLIVLLIGSFSLFDPTLVYYLEFIALLFIFFPKLYKTLHFEKIAVWALRLSSNSLRFLSYLPLVELRGVWMLEPRGDVKDMKTIKGLSSFILSHWYDFVIVNAGLVALGVRIAFNIQLHILNEGESSDVLAFSPIGIIFGFMWVPVCLALYFSWVWVWEDSGLKIAKAKSRELDSTEIEIGTVWLASESIRNLIIFLAGFSTIVWFSEQFDPIDAPATVTAIIILLILVFLTGGLAILMGVMYYRSGVHEEFVNNLRHVIRTKNQEAVAAGRNYPINIGTTMFQEFNPEKH